MSKTSIDFPVFSSLISAGPDPDLHQQKQLHLQELRQKAHELREQILISRSDLNPFFKRSFEQNKNLLDYHKKITCDIKTLRGNVMQYGVMLQELNRKTQLRLEVTSPETEPAVAVAGGSPLGKVDRVLPGQRKREQMESVFGNLEYY